VRTKKGEMMVSFDYDVLIIGSGFGGSVAALRAAKRGSRVGVLESGRQALNLYEVQEANGSIRIRV
jgi:choline dehydrogenase-like flavoprotein